MTMKKILVVEDDPINLQILSDFLGANGYQIDGAASGPDGLARFSQGSPDLVLLDVQLPRQNGFEVCSAIKKTGSPTPVVLMSAVYTDRDHVERMTARGIRADAYLEKPFDLRLLLDQIRRLVG
jgi:DNA-binding response OmpR family regulator